MPTPRGWSLRPARRDEPELMDEPGLPEAEVADAYRVLQRVNQQLGNRATLRSELRRFVREDRPGDSPSLLDVGSGSGDLAHQAGADLTRLGCRPSVAVLDRDPTALALAHGSGLPAFGGDALRLPWPDASIDLVTAVKFAHHFSGAGLERLLSEMARVARRRVVVLDIERHWLAYAGFVAWSRVFTRNRLVRYDGPLSVLRGFTASELQALGATVPGFAWTVRTRFPFQLVLVGRRLAPSARAEPVQRPRPV